MRVLFLTIQFPPDVNSSGVGMERIGEGLVRRGHDVSVITSFPHYANFRVVAEYRGRVLERASQNGMRVLRVPVYARGRKDRLLHRGLSYVSYNAFAALAALVSGRHYDVILAQNGSFLTGVSARAAGGLRKTPYVYNVRDLYPEVPIAQGKLQSARLAALVNRVADYMYDRAAHVTVITPSFGEVLVRRGVPADKVTVIPNGADVAFIRPLPKENDWGRAHGLADRFVVTHAGNVGWVYGLETLLEVARRTTDLPDVLYLIVGDGVAKPDLENRTRRMGLRNVRFLPYQPHSALPWLRAASDVQLALYKPHGASYSMPSKVYEIMASARPMLASAEPGSDLAQLVRTTGCGLVVDPEDVDGLEAAVRRLWADPAGREAMGQAGRRWAEAEYSWDAIAARYESLLRRVAEARRP